MNNKSALYGLLGRNISHSFSPGYFTNKFLKENIDARFDLFDIHSINELPNLLKSMPELRGFSVTIPYKQEVMNFLDHISPEAINIGAVNCVKVTKNGLAGYNTDAIGFLNSLKPLIQGKTNINALLLGTGGASKAVAYVLKSLSIPFKTISRTAGDNIVTYDELNKEIIKSSQLIINATPVGMFPNIDKAPSIPYEHLTKHHILYDLVYNPAETLFLKKGRREGAVIKNGLEMLHLQAEAAWEIWHQ